MRKIGMMQPYLFPYLGYFQLIFATDVFVLGDNLQFVKESWMNRNQILEHGKPFMISFPLKKSSHLSKINDKVFADNYVNDRETLMKRIRHSYANAPAKHEFLPLLEEIMSSSEMNFAKFAENSIRRICDYLEIRTPILVASRLHLEEARDKQDRVIQTMKKLHGDVYINPRGGMKLYDADYFRQHGIALRFHHMDEITYRQHGREFVPSLSIIDVLMFNKKEKAMEMLAAYTLRPQQNFEEAPEEMPVSTISNFG